VVKAEEGRETTTIVVGEASKARDPAVSEWSNPLKSNLEDFVFCTRGQPPELKHLSRGRKKNSLSSGERKGRSLNLVLRTRIRIISERASFLKNIRIHSYVELDKQSHSQISELIRIETKLPKRIRIYSCSRPEGEVLWDANNKESQG
jgi:hypothetical protein